MRIVVNCRSIMLSNRTGIGRYTYNLLDQLGQVDVSNQYYLYAQKKLFDFKRKMPHFRYSNFKSSINYFNGNIPRAEIYHLPCPADIEKFDGKVIVTIHDLIYKTYPQSHTQETIDLTEKYMQGIVKRADKIICTSQSTRTDLHRFFDYPQMKSCAILNGVDNRIFHPLENYQITQNKFLDNKGIKGDFLLFVGTLEPRKNLFGLLEAMKVLKTTLPLVVVGMQGWKSDDVLLKVKQMGLEEQVIFTGFISDQELNFLYNTCKVFIFPSFYEGFGFPIVEALSAGACVICSSNSSCGEIAGDAALLIDPHDPVDIAAKIKSVLDDKTLLAAYKLKGVHRAEKFSFKQTAQRTYNVYQSL